MNWLSLLVPFAYLGILLTSLATFSSLYRKRKLLKSVSLAPYFGPHIQRDIYLSLLHLSDSDSDEKAANTKVPDSVLRAALLARATEDIQRIMEIRTRKPALSTLLQRGQVGEEIWQRLLRAEAEIEAEVKDVVQEANAFAPNWGQTIFQSANEMANNALLKKKLAAITASVPVEKERWEKERESVKEELMRELDEDKAAQTQPQQQSQAQAQAAAAERRRSSTGATASSGGGEKGPKGQSSDEDAVLVETPGSNAAAILAASVGAASGGSGGGTGGKGKKKKGKK